MVKEYKAPSDFYWFEPDDKLGKYVIIYPNGTKSWYKDGKRHRENGPAIECADGNKSYYLNDEQFIKEKYIEYIKSKSICPAKKSRILLLCI